MLDLGIYSPQYRVRSHPPFEYTRLYREHAPTCFRNQNMLLRYAVQLGLHFHQEPESQGAVLFRNLVATQMVFPEIRVISCFLERIKTKGYCLVICAGM